MGTTQNAGTPFFASAPDPDPSGDLIFLLGDARRPIRVSSKVMGLASRVFKAMLSSNFLKKPLCVDDPPELPLPEDDPTAMVWFCKAIHHREMTNASLPKVVLKNLAIICDKYDCAVALRPWSAMFLFALQRNLSPMSGALGWEVMWMSRAFDDQDAFYRNTRSFVWQAPRELRPKCADPDGVDAVGLSLLPERLWDALKCIKSDLSRNLHLKIDKIIEPYLIPDFCARRSSHGLEILDPNTCLRSARVLHFFQELHRLEVWPIRGKLSNNGIASVTSSLRQYTNFLPMTITNCTCMEQVDFKALIGKAVKETEQEPRHLCLNCVKRGYVSLKEGNCRALERDQCKLKQSGGTKEGGDTAISL